MEESGSPLQSWNAFRRGERTLGVVLATWVGALALLPCSAPAQTLDRVLVVVNDDVITQREFDRELDAVREELSARNTRMPPDEVLARQSLERMIATRVQLHRADQLGIRIPERAVDDAVEVVASQNGLSVEQLRTAVERDGVPFEEFRDRVEEELTIRRLRETQISPQVVVTEEEIDSAMVNQPIRDGTPQEYDVSHILVSVSENASAAQEQQAREQIEQALADLRAGAGFADVAARYSDSGDALEGGRLGWRGPAQLPELFVLALVGMAPGDVSDVLRSPNGFHLLRLNESRGGSQRTVNQYRIRHILIRPDDVQSEDEVRQRLALLRQRIENGADFAELARANSMDPGSRARGGELGWVSRRDVDPAIQQVLGSLEVGEVSRPVESPFGYHILLLEETRKVEIGTDADRETVREQIFARKVDELYERWVRELMDQAFIKYN